MGWGHADDISVESSQCKHVLTRRNNSLHAPWTERTQWHKGSTGWTLLKRFQCKVEHALMKQLLKHYLELVSLKY